MKGICLYFRIGKGLPAWKVRSWYEKYKTWDGDTGANFNVTSDAAYRYITTVLDWRLGWSRNR